MKELRIPALCAIAALMVSCQRGPGEVVDKVLVDFGVRDKPEGYVSGADKVFEKLSIVAKAEMRRMNQKVRHGEVKFEDEKGLKGKYYKEVKVYEDFYPLDAQPIAKTTGRERGYAGYIEYAYRVYQSRRKANRVDAEAQTADIPTDQEGRETYRYVFNSAGEWDGGNGNKTRR